MNSAHAAELAHHQQEADERDVLGFWLYILTDCILFGSLFAVYLVLHAPGSYGPALAPLVSLPYVLGETFLLLVSNLTFGLAAMSLSKKQFKMVTIWLLFTLLFGLGFIFMEVNEFIHLVHEGYDWTKSGAASSFFTLVGTHGLHVTFGLLWILVLLFQLPKIKQHATRVRRMTYLGMFWNFLDIVWIFVFTLVYLMGAI